MIAKSNFFSVKLLLPKIQNRKLERSIGFLISKRSHISGFGDIDDFIWYGINNSQENELAGFEYHFGVVRLEIARKLWEEGVFIGINVIESLFFSLIKDQSIDDPLKSFLERLQDFGLHRPGFVIYPIHSLGILGFGIYRFLTGTEAYFLSADANIAVTPQANSQEALHSIVDQISSGIGVKQKIPRDLLEHYIESRHLGWLVFNPLMFVKVRSFSNSYYENQFLLLVKLRISKAVILMMSVLGETLNDNGKTSKYFSSSSINNFQTLDIKHYLVFQAPPGRKRYLEIKCVPMNSNSAELVEMSSLNVELNPSEWRRRVKLSIRIRNALVIVETGYIKNCISNIKETVKTRVYRKIFDSLKYFERSFREQGHFILKEA